MVIKPYNARNNMERILQRKHNFVSIENFIRCKSYHESISDRGEKSNFRRGPFPQIFFLYKTVLSVTSFYKICGLPKAGRLLKTFPFHLEWKSFSKYQYNPQFYIFDFYPWLVIFLY